MPATAPAVIVMGILALLFGILCLCACCGCGRQRRRIYRRLTLHRRVHSEPEREPDQDQERRLVILVYDPHPSEQVSIAFGIKQQEAAT